MLDIKRIRENLDDIKKAMDRRGEKEFDLDAVIALDDERRELLKEVEVMKGEMNIESKKIPQLIKEGKDKNTPVAFISWATRYNQRVVTATLESAYEVAIKENIK